MQRVELGVEVRIRPAAASATAKKALSIWRGGRSQSRMRTVRGA